jgi:cell division protein FtsL
LHVPRLALRRPQAPRLDRIVRGRAWIPVLGVTLVAIVGLRVEVLKLGSTVGSQVQLAAVLQSSNSQLRAEISALSDNQRIEKLAQDYGMQMPQPLDLHFLPGSSGRDVGAAIRNISAPSRSTFLTNLATERQSNLRQAAQNSTLSAIGGPASSPVTTGSSSALGATSVTSAGTGLPSGTSTGSIQVGASGSGALATATTTPATTTSSGTSSAATGSVSSSSTTGTAVTGTSYPSTTGSSGTTGTSGTAGGDSQTIASANGGAALSG